MEYLQLHISHKIFLVESAQLDQLVYGNEIVAVDDLYRFQPVRDLMCAEKTGGFNLVNYRHSSGVYHEQETEDLHRRI